jgi:V/A-type H+-transporting ATPase subunit K
MDGLALSLLGAAAAAFLAGIGSSIGVGLAGQASTGVIGEDPEKFGKVMLLTALPGTQGIYGFVIAFLVLLKLNILGGDIPAVTTAQGWHLFFACLPVAIAGMLSAVHQGKVCAAGVQMTAKRPEESGKALILGVFVEFYAVLGFLASFLVSSGVQVGS